MSRRVIIGAIGGDDQRAIGHAFGGAVAKAGCILLTGGEALVTAQLYGLSGVNYDVRKQVWLARVSGVLVVWAVVSSLVWFVLSGWPGTGGDHVLLLIVLCLLTTPLQAAGEEFLVRGWITQSVGAWFARPLPGAVVAGLVSATVFALLHGSQNLWLFGDRFVFGLVASYLVWRTGGLEAAVALHTISNISSIVPAALEGSLDDALTLTEAPVATVVLDVVMLLVAAFLVAWLARRDGLTRLGPVVPASR